MKILYTIADLQPESGGPSRSVSSLASAVAQQGPDVELLALEYGPSHALPLIPPYPVRTTLVPCRGNLAQRIKWTRAFASALQQHCAAASEVTGGLQRNATAADLSRRSGTKAGFSNFIIHDTGLWLRTNHAVAAVTRKFQLLRVVSPRGMLTQWALQHRSWKKRLAWHLYQQRDLRLAQVLHATSAAEISDFRAAGLSQPIALIPNGVWLPPPAQNEESSRQEMEIGCQRSEIKTILFLGRIHPIKGLTNLAAAWALVRNRFVHPPLALPSSINYPPSSIRWRLVLAGDGEPAHLADLQAEIRRLGVEQDFEFVGPVAGEAKWDLYRSANVCVLPSHSENFGLVVAEALACGVPVIASRATPWENLITHRCGWWVDNHPEVLANALLDAMNRTDEERQEMGQRGRELVEENYTWSAAAKKMITVYAWLLRREPKPPFVFEKYVKSTN